MSKPMAHLSEWTLEQMAEGMLPEPEQRGAMAHLERCTRCAAELDAYRTLFVALAGLPRFAPSAGFADAVMSRLQVAPGVNPMLARVRRWLPSTRRGWMMLAAALLVPALPVLGLLVWLVTHPLVSTVELWQWTALKGAEAAQAVTGAALRWDASVGLSGTIRSAYAAARGAPLSAWIAAVAVLAVGIPLSAWSLVRLVRTPMGKVTYAN